MVEGFICGRGGDVDLENGQAVVSFSDGKSGDSNGVENVVD